MTTSMASDIKFDLRFEIRILISVAPDPDSNLNSSLISIPDSGKLGSGKILCYQALDLIQVNSLNQADIMLPKLAGQQVSILIHMYCDKCK